MKRPPVLVLEITLKGVMPFVWRIVQVKKKTTLHELHLILQAAMGWKYQHLYNFAQRRGNETILFEMEDREEEGLRLLRDNDPAVVLVSDVLLAEGDELTYLYDFGDHWEHRVVLKGFVTQSRYGAIPNCPAGAGKCPPENIGGAPAYMQFMEAWQQGDKKVMALYRKITGESFRPFDYAPEAGYFFHYRRK